MTNSKTDHIPDAAEKVELLNCPFCGEQPEIYHDLTLDWVIRCDYRRCGARASVNSSPKEKAITAWNTRHDSRASVLDEVLEQAETMAWPYRLNDSGEAVGPEKFWVKISDLKKLLGE